MAGLSDALTLPCGVSIDNRIAKSAMTEGLADPQDQATAAHDTLYQRWSEGGAGLLFTGNVMVDRRYLERPGNVVIDQSTQLDELRRWAAAGTIAGNQLWMQISHVGRQANRACKAQPLAPSATALRLGALFRKPRAMTEVEIKSAIEAYALVAKTAQRAGFTGVQIHAAHGYLISQFLSPRINQRNDSWGGALANRARFLLETVRLVRKAVGPDFPVSVKLNSSDFQKGGFDDQESAQVAIWLEQEGIDLLELSGGNYEQPQFTGHDGLEDSAQPPQRESTKLREAYFLRYAEMIAREVTIPVMVTGGFRSRAAMQQALARDEIQMIGIARPFCVVPDLARKLIQGELEQLLSYEHQLNLGHGFFGPTSPLFLFKLINVQGEVAWFYRQIVRLAQGQEADPKLGLLRALWQHLLSEQKLARRRSFK